MKKRWKLLATFLVATQMFAPMVQVGALALDGNGATSAGYGGGGGGGGGGGAIFYGVAGLQWTPANGGDTITDTMWGNVNPDSSDVTNGGITYYSNGQGSSYTVPEGYTGYYMEGYQFSNPSNSMWNDYNITRAMWPEDNWLFKKDIGGWEDAWGAGALADPQAHRQAIEDGYTFNSWDVYQNGNNWMDAIFYQPVKKYKKAGDYGYHRTITKAKGTKGDFDNSYKLHSQSGLEELYYDNTTSVPYGDETSESGPNSGLPGQTYNKELEVTVSSIRRHVEYYPQESKDGGKTWTPLRIKDIWYSYVGSNTYHGLFKYNVNPETVEQPWFRPMDLNRNGLADESDVKKDFFQYQSGGPSVALGVDNKQNITDGKTGLQTLDTNTSTSFDVTFYDKLGIPSSYMPLLDSRPSSLDTHRPGTTGMFTQYTDGEVQNSKSIDGYYSDYASWNGSLLAGVNSKNASLTYNGKEQVGPSATSILGVSSGTVNFLFKTIKVGDAFLTNGTSRRWWTVNYTRGEQYTYGMGYEGVVTLDGISNASTTKSNMYKAWNSAQLEQPLLKGKFTAKTVAGDIGN